MSLWFVGALLSATGSIASNLGVNIQKYSFLKNAKVEAELQRPYTKQPLWMLGLVLVIFGSLGDFAALALAAQSIIAPIGSITLVSNVLFAHWGLKEPLSKRDIIGTCLIILGSTLSVAFGNHSEQTYTLDELKDLYIQTGFICYGFILLFVCICLYLVVKRLQPIKQEMVEKCQEYETAVSNESETRDSKLIDSLDVRIAELEKQYEPYEKIHPFAYCALSGCLGAQSILFGKMLAEMIGMSFRGNNQMIYPLTYVFLACMLFCIFSQLHFLAIGLSYFDALYVVPVFQCFFITVSTLGGAAYFNEFSTFTALQSAMFPIGILLTLTGVYILSSREMKKTIQRGPGAEALKPGMEISTDEENQVKSPVSPSEIEMKPTSRSASRGGRLDAPNFDGPIVSVVPEMDELAVGTAGTETFIAAGENMRSDDDIAVGGADETGSQMSMPSRPVPIGSSGKMAMPPPEDEEAPPPPPPFPAPHSNGHLSSSMPTGNGHHLSHFAAEFEQQREFRGGSMPKYMTDRRMSRFAQEVQRKASMPDSLPPSSSLPAGDNFARRVSTINRGSLGAPGTASYMDATNTLTRDRKRSHWNNTYSRGSVFHAGLAVLGVQTVE